jgi:resuscitation-promoting factor RpfA
MTGPEYDAELEAFLKRRSMMHRRLSDIDDAEPSVELDRLVLNRAREAIETPAQPLYRTSRWALPIGLAATILIAFTVVLNIDHQSAKVASNASPAAAEAAPQAPAPAVARATSASEPERIQQPRLLSDSAARERRDATVEKKTESPVALARRAQRPDTERAEEREIAGSTADSAPLMASTGAAASHGMVAPPAPATAATPPPAADPHASADAWLREISRLRTAGRTVDADRELAAFREAYPSHPAYSVAKPPTR